ncbi:hypothetical protein V6N13_137354 [Hibiscus sabdariffa]
MPPKKITEAGLSEVLQSGNPVRIANKSLINYIFTLSLEVASQFDFPLQIHIGFGDKDSDLRLSNPLHLQKLLQDERFSRCPIVLLHASYPLSKEASYLASVYAHVKILPQVYLDFGLAIPKLSVHGMISLVQIRSHICLTSAFVGGVDFKIKLLTVGGKRLKLTVWDTAGQERFRTLTGSYYRGAQGIILVYDVTRRETFTNLSDVWAKEVELYSTNQDCIKILVGNIVDRDSERAVSREEGTALAKELGCMFLECSAKTRENVEQCFQELALKIMEVPSFLEEGSAVGKRNILKQKPEGKAHQGRGCCS